MDNNYEYVNHPSHYGGKDNVYECIKVIDAWNLNFCLGTAVRYICRAGQKPDNPDIQDLEKAIWYLQHEIELRKQQQLCEYNFEKIAQGLADIDCTSIKSATDGIKRLAENLQRSVKGE